MNATHQLLILKMLVKTYFSEEVQCDESFGGAQKRKELKKAIIEMAKED